ncbi:MAG: AAA family ATPase, partial [Thermoleophilia bacterium]
MKDKKIITFIGRISSGKGTAAAYLVEKYGAEMFTFSNILRDVIQRLKLEETRDNFIRMSEILRGAFGEDLLSRIMAADATAATSEIVAIDGTRRETDVEHLKDLPGFVLVAINAEPKIRYERLSKRNVKADDQTKTYEEFLADEQRSTEVSINEIIDSATHQIDN